MSTVPFYNELNDTLQKAFAEQFQRLKDAGVSSRSLTVVATKGYGPDDNFTVTYYIGEYGDTDKCSGNNLDAVVTEYMRRKGWTERNKPMVMLTASAEFT